MLKKVAFFFLIVSSYSSFSQTTEEKLEELQIMLSTVETTLDNQSKEALVQKIKALKNVESERDSLELVLELYRTKMSLVETALQVCSGNEKNTINREERANSFARVNISSNGGKNSDLKKGYYVVVGSERDIDFAKKTLKKIQLEYPNLKLMIAQNLIKSWYHICLEQSYTNETVQKQVNQSQEDGFDDAWFILLD